jgi:hypothetical protein
MGKDRERREIKIILAIQKELREMQVGEMGKDVICCRYSKEVQGARQAS